MPIFRDTVAQEPCPTKTAESVSYWATFAVLGGLLIGNFFGIDDAGTESSSMAVTEPGFSSESDSALSSPAAAMPAEYLAASSPSLLSTNVPSPSPLTLEIETLEDSQLADLAAWHSNLSQTRQSPSRSDIREFSNAAWGSKSQHPVHLAEPLIEGLSLPLPIIDTDFLFRPVTGPELASLEADSSRAIHEITITGAEPTRLTVRPDSIRRPQIPRPYRAQEVQRSLVLPPRIQALRP